MATKAKKTAKREFQVTRYWPVEYRSIAYVQASSPEEAANLALEDDDYSDQESCDGSDGPTEIGVIVEITPEGLEIEHRLPEVRDVDAAAAAAGPELLAAIEAAVQRSIERQEMGGRGGVLDDDIFQTMAALIHRCKA